MSDLGQRLMNDIQISMTSYDLVFSHIKASESKSEFAVKKAKVNLLSSFEQSW